MAILNEDIDKWAYFFMSAIHAAEVLRTIARWQGQAQRYIKVSSRNLIQIAI